MDPAATFSDPQNLTVLGVSPFYQSQCFLGNLYHEDSKDTTNTVDYTGEVRECGFGFAADTTGHYYVREDQLKKKEELAQLWKGFQDTLHKGLLTKLQGGQKMSWEEYRGEVARSMIQIGGKMMDIGKTSTFCGLFAIWVVNEKTKEKPQPAAVIVQLGDSAIYRFRGSEGFKCDVLTQTKGRAWEGYVGGSTGNVLIELSPLKSGDFFLITTDGIEDHFGKEMKRRHEIGEKIEVLNGFSQLISQAVEEIVAPDGSSEGGLEKVYQSLLNHSRNMAHQKLKEGVIGDSELDDVGCTLVLTNFFNDDAMKNLKVSRQSPPPPQGFFARFFPGSRKGGEEKGRERERGSYWEGKDEERVEEENLERRKGGIFDCFNCCPSLFL